MGNRATVIFTDGNKEFSPAVYLHWNGGPESIYGFLEELDRRKVRADQMYETARFIQIVGEFMDQDGISGLSLGVTNGPESDKIEDLEKVPTDQGNNGIYLVNRTSTLSMRRFIEEWKGDKAILVEQTPEWVDSERHQAENHKYREEFREFYAKLTEGKKISKF